VKILLRVYKNYYFISHTKTSSSISGSGNSGGGGGKLVQVIG
jgi:hypothetical protein